MTKIDEKEKTIWEFLRPENETESIRQHDIFFLSKTPKWFEFVSWLFLIGGLDYLNKQTKHWFLVVLFIISYAFLYFFLQSFLYNFPFYKILSKRFIGNKKFAYNFSIIIGGVLLIAIYLSLNSAINIFSIH